MKCVYIYSPNVAAESLAFLLCIQKSCEISGTEASYLSEVFHVPPGKFWDRTFKQVKFTFFPLHHIESPILPSNAK